MMLTFLTQLIDVACCYTLLLFVTPLLVIVNVVIVKPL